MFEMGPTNIFFEGMDTAVLRDCPILADLSDEEIQNIAYVVVNGDRGQQNAFFIDKDSNVYGVGPTHFLTLKCESAGKDIPPSGGKVKIDEMCGLGLKKIVVGSSLVGGVANNGKAYVWYFPSKAFKEDEVVIMFRNYQASTYCCIAGCGCTNNCYYSSRSVGKVNLCVCSKNRDLFHTYTAKSPPPPGLAVTKFVNSRVCNILCPKCCCRCKSVQLGTHAVEYCENCGIYPQAPSFAMEKDVYLDILDIACGEHFVALLTRSNNLFVSGTIKNASSARPVPNPDQIAIKAISCGFDHLAAVSSRGELYTCGWEARAQLGYPSDEVDITLRKVSLEGVDKVCCGRSTTVCLKLDGSLYAFGSNMKVTKNGNVLFNQLDTDVISVPAEVLAGKKIVDIACQPFTNKFYAQTKESMVYSWGDRSDISFLEVVSVSSLRKTFVSLPITMSRVECASKENHHTASSPPSNDYASLYGDAFLSDLVLKLSDSDFPVHKLVLFSKSVYFRNYILKEKTSLPAKLDMTSYNPVAYKTLLKYFYQIPPDDLDCSDLLDLYLLATSYKETDIMTDSYNRLKEKISVDTIKMVHTKAKSAGCQDLLEQCDVFVRTPEFQAILFERFAQNPESTLSQLF